MNKNVTFDAKRSAIKIGIMAVITLILLIPLSMIRSLIEDREITKYEIIDDVKRSYAGSQIVDSPIFDSEVVTKDEKTNKDSTLTYSEKCAQVDIKAEINTDELHRSIYDVIVYNSKVIIKGNFVLPDEVQKGKNLKVKMKIADLKGLMDTPQISLMGKEYKFDVDGSEELYTKIELPIQEHFDNNISFTMCLDIKGTEQLMFAPSADETTVSIRSIYPNPSFVGEYLPISRDVNEKGFTATWKVLKINKKDSSYFGVDFIKVASQYQQAMRSAKYGMLIICLVFVAGLLVEFVTHKQIHIVQYAVIGLSLALFYSLLTAFSDIISFGWSYLIAASMTTLVLTLYYKGILKNKSAWVLGGFISIMYGANYILLQMENYSLLAGSLLLFVLLSVMMYFTANMNKAK